jgi:uncharacterized protein (TIGR03435 family)
MKSARVSFEKSWTLHWIRLVCVQLLREVNLRRRFEALALAAAVAAAVHAQPAEVSAKFEAASIKLCKTEDVGTGGGKTASGTAAGRIRWDPQRLTEECQSLDNLIRDAYLAYPEGKAWTAAYRHQASADASGASCTGCGRGMPPVSGRTLHREIQGSPGWANSTRYTIEAKAERPATPEMMRGPMMQSLLEERFHLKIRRGTRDTPVYELTAMAGGPKLQPSHDGSCIAFSEILKVTNGAPLKYRGLPVCDGWNSHNGKTMFADMTIARFCEFLSTNLDRDVIDKTGIAGRFDLQIDADRAYLPAADSQPPGDGMPFMPEIDDEATAKAFQRALPKIGLKLEPAKGAGVVLVIDHVERPTEN